MWLIKQSKKSMKQLKKVPKEIREEFEVWRKVIELSGPQALRKIPGYRDHSLQGEWKGARSSSLNIKWRVIYYVQKKEVMILVMEVNAHEYKK